MLIEGTKISHIQVTSSATKVSYKKSDSFTPKVSFLFLETIKMELNLNRDFLHA